MKGASLLFTIVAGISLIGIAAHDHIDQGPPKYDRKVEGEWILGPTLKWPLDGSDGRGNHSRETARLLAERSERGREAYKTYLILENDREAIRKLVFEALDGRLSKQTPKMGEVTKVSETEYMVSGSFEEIGYRFVVANTKTGWVLLGWYLDWIS